MQPQSDGERSGSAPSRSGEGTVQKAKQERVLLLGVRKRMQDAMKQCCAAVLNGGCRAGYRCGDHVGIQVACTAAPGGRCLRPSCKATSGPERPELQSRQDQGECCRQRFQLGVSMCRLCSMQC